VGSGGANCPPEVYKTIDLGCGENKVEGAIGVDEAALPGVDVVHDLLSFPYPFGENRAEEVYLRNVLEHFALSDIRKILREVHRMLLPGGVVHIHVPHVFSVAGWADPTHRTWFTFVSGEFFDTGSAKAYYKGFDSIWDLAGISSRVTWFNWKRYRLRRLDDWLSSQMAAFLDRLLKSHTWPGAADLFVRVCPMFFVEIRWQLRKPLNK
jgi:SAM-dependent methyltransferase